MVISVITNVVDCLLLVIPFPLADSGVVNSGGNEPSSADPSQWNELSLANALAVLVWKGDESTGADTAHEEVYAGQ